MEKFKKFMKKVKDFIVKYKAEILIALSAVTSIIASISTMEGVDAVACSISIAFIAVLVEVLKNGFSETAINLLASAIKLVIDYINGKDKVEDKDVENNVRALKLDKKELTVAEIKEKLKENL